MDNAFDLFKKEKDGTMVWIAAVKQLSSQSFLKNTPANIVPLTSVRER